MQNRGGGKVGTDKHPSEHREGGAEDATAQARTDGGGTQVEDTNPTSRTESQT